MSENEDKVVQNNNNDKNKNPVDQAINKLREAKLKALQAKVDSKSQASYDAKVVSDKAFEEFKEAIEELEFEKARINQFAKDAK